MTMCTDTQRTLHSFGQQNGRSVQCIRATFCFALFTVLACLLQRMKVLFNISNETTLQNLSQMLASVSFIHSFRIHSWHLSVSIRSGVLECFLVGADVGFRSKLNLTSSQENMAVTSV
jgi:hypothetical protein